MRQRRGRPAIFIFFEIKLQLLPFGTSPLIKSRKNILITELQTAGKNGRPTAEDDYLQSL
jgi:hypothetical protein